MSRGRMTSRRVVGMNCWQGKTAGRTPAAFSRVLLAISLGASGGASTLNGYRLGLPGGGVLSKGATGAAQDAVLRFGFQSL